MTESSKESPGDHSDPDFLLIGILVASWILSGTIPTIMVYGFKLVSVRFFLPTAFLVCAIVGVTVGSSFTTISTIGIAFLGNRSFAWIQRCNDYRCGRFWCIFRE